ncbi:MAG: hypothetical protein NTV60_01230 [Candidatus Kaiserbacteria bacterium]|nr:hypothetical protein [Candidatus Kaiserbacteria bacterium]
MKKHARSRRFASYGVLGLAGILAIIFISLLPKADHNVAISVSHTTEWSEQLGAGEVFSACDASPTWTNYCTGTDANHPWEIWLRTVVYQLLSGPTTVPAPTRTIRGRFGPTMIQPLRTTSS